MGWNCYWEREAEGVPTYYYPTSIILLYAHRASCALRPSYGSCVLLFTIFRPVVKLGCWGLTWTQQKLENGRIGTLEAPPQLRTTSERSSGLLSVAWKACQTAPRRERPE